MELKSGELKVKQMIFLTCLPVVVRTMMAAAMQEKEASTAAIAIEWVESVNMGVSRRRSSNCCLWNTADSASAQIWNIDKTRFKLKDKLDF